MSRKVAAGGDDVMELREAWVHNSCPSGPKYRGLRIHENGPFRNILDSWFGARIAVYCEVPRDYIVIVERSDPLGLRHKIRRPLLRHALDEIQDSLLGCRIVPCWKGIG